MQAKKRHTRLLIITIPLLPLAIFLCSCVATQPTLQGSDALPDSLTCTHIKPTFPDSYYVDQGVKYFLTMESSIPIKVKPNYGEKVVRWEWPPWLLLTGYGRRNLILSDIVLKLYPTKYDTIECRAFDRQPFCRCHVIFNYSGKKIPIYEEFVFNPQGEITFIEAWSDFPGWLPMDPADYWAESDTVKRLSTRVPGLGNATGRIDPHASWSRNAARNDPDLADLFHRIHRPLISWLKEAVKQREEMEKADRPPDEVEVP